MSETIFEDIIARGIEDRAERIQAIQDAIDAGHVPDGAMCERLSNYILREELTDKTKNKVAAEEYPFFSERQFERRHSAEVSLQVAEEIGTDGKSYRPPSRRKRGRGEKALVDKFARSRNQRRRRAYGAFLAGKDTYMHEGRAWPIAFIRRAVPVR